MNKIRSLRSVCCHFMAALAALAALTACSDGDTLPTVGDISLGDDTISLAGLNDNAQGFDVQLRDITTNSIFIEQTNAEGKATFHITPGIYEASVSAVHSDNGYTYLYNGSSGQIAVRTGQTTTVTIQMKQARLGQLVIKELYNGGCMADDGVTKFQYDKYMVLYNNSAQIAAVNNLCIGELAPANAQASNNNYTAEGRLNYEGEGFVPAWNGIWYFPNTLEIAPYSQVVINIHGAIDNTQTVSQSVNFANADYYCMFDPESGYKNASYYPAPSEQIPTSHYLKAVEFGLGNAWAISVTSPALIVFQTHGVTPADFALDVNNNWYDGGMANQSKLCVKVPNDWIVDALEVYTTSAPSTCVKRLTADLDAGYVWLTNFQGHSLYRNVDKAATEALPENKDKLVYNYVLGVDDSSDPSGIDAEASIKNGAHIIYQETNNSTNDFHERQSCSLRN